MTALVYDLDELTAEQQPALDVPFEWLAHTTYSGAWRLVVPLASEYSVNEWQKMWQGFARLYKLTVDPSTKDPSRLYYLPSHPPSPTFQPQVIGNVL